MLTLYLISTITSALAMLWGVAGFIIIVDRYIGVKLPDRVIDASRTYFHEVKMLYPFLSITDAACHIATHDWHNPKSSIGLVLDLAAWWFIRNLDEDDEDRWKRRKDKLTEKISQVGSRLVVQPATN